MASIVTTVLKATVGLILNKGRDLAADKLQEGDLTEQQFRNMIVREIDDIKSKLDGLARKDLLTSISLFKEGIVFLYKVLDEKFICKEGTATKQGSREGTTQLSLQSFGTDVDKVSLLRGIDSLDDSGKRALADAKKRFDEARMKATEAFNNVALSTSDRIVAIQYRVMCTILEKIDNPKEAIAACKLCLEELHSMPAVSKSFKVETTGGFLSLFNKEERAEIVQSVCDVNRVVFRVAMVADGVLSRELDAWPCVKIGEREVNPSILRRYGDGVYASRVLPWSFGQEGEEEHKLQLPQSIVTNSKGQFIVADIYVIKVFDCSGKFMFSLSSVFDAITDVATDREDNVYAMTFSSKVIVFDKEGKLNRFFGERPIEYIGISVTVNGNGKVFVLIKSLQNCEDNYRVAVHQADGEVVNNFSVSQFVREPTSIISGSEDHVMVWSYENHIHVLDAEGHLLKSLSSPLIYYLPPVRVIAFHLSTEHILIPSGEYHDNALNIEILTKDGERVRNLRMETGKICYVSGITVTTDGRIAVLCTIQEIQSNDRKHLVLVE